MASLSGFAHAEAGWVSRSHRAIPPFHLHRPGSLGEAGSLWRGSRGAILMAGGIDVIAGLRDGAPATDLVWLGAVADLRAVDRHADWLRLGAGVTHHRVETDPLIARFRPDIALAWRTIGNIRVRLAGTIGGNVMAANPQYDGPAILAAAGARFVFDTPDGPRTIDPAQDSSWAPPPGGLLTAIEIPSGNDCRVLFDRSLKPAISAAIGVSRDPDGRAVGRIAIGCAYPRPVIRDLDLGGGALADPSAVADALATTLPPPLGDAVASSDYRRRMAGVLARRLLARLTADGDAAS